MSKNTNIYSGQPILGQLLSFFPKEIFDSSVSAFNSDAAHSTVSTWHQFAFMSYGVLTGCSTLREISKNLSIFGAKLAQCCITSIPARSSISDANRLRNSAVFGDFYLKLCLHFAPHLSDSYLKLPINNEVSPKIVEIFDSTTVSLFSDVFKNCGRIPDSGKKKGGIKAFTKIKLSERVPNFVCLKAASTNEKAFLAELSLTPGSICVFDKGYNKYAQYQEWTDSKVFFVTRLNDNAKFKIIKNKPLEEINELGVQQDSEIELTYLCPETKTNQSVIVRMVAFIDPETKNKLLFVTNLNSVKALTISMLYKNRWTIEPLFKQLKQNFELTYFLSDSEEGIKTQIWVAMILNLIFTVIHKMVKECEDFSTMVKIAAKNTTSYVNFKQFIKDPTILMKPKNEKHGIVQYSIFETTKGGGFDKSG